ncbi:MAG: primosomal protein N' [Polyangia bacterium]
MSQQPIASNQQTGGEPPPADESTLPTFWEVAVALPVPGTFTYRDPRPGGRIVSGTQVVVPFGGRTVTGFVLGPAVASGTRFKPRDIEAVVPGTPAFDEQMMGLARWAAEYYQAPLGELLRAGLPQGERAEAVRQVRLTAAGERAARDPGGGSPQIALDGVGASAPVWDPLLRLLVESGGEVPWRLIARRLAGRGGPTATAAAAAAHIGRLEAAGLVEVGDEVRDRRAPPTRRFVAAAASDVVSAAVLPARARARRAVLEKVRAAPADEGLAVDVLTASERAQLRALTNAGLVRVEQRPIPLSKAGADDQVGAPAARVGAKAGECPPTPTAGQAHAIREIIEALGKGYATFLLQGVTGSGKTEVYLRVIAEARAAGRGALVLVPEIALTPQLAGRFRARFGDDVAVLHSALPPRERLAAWRRLRLGEVGIALGARSAVFAPVRELGVLVVDEEHDPSFKQEEGVRYHGRDMAVMRAQRAGAVAVLGSATPSLESRRNAELGRFRHLLLPERATPRTLPPVEIVDLRRHPPGPDGLLSTPLAEAVAANLAAGQQTILFLNRRGFSTVVLCRACGLVVRCAHCAVSMTYHRGRDRLVCHYCGTQESVPALCPACRLPKLERLGMGTERVEALIRGQFPDARVARLDRDTAGASAAGAPERGGHLNEVLRAMNAGEIDILVGTQMVTKGHDFGGVTLVGVLQPDQAMHLPDFRASERVFQLLEQVAGRAGRGDRPGRVIVQTYNPEHPAIVAVRTHDYEGFVRAELEARAELGYPPFTRMVVLRLDGPDEARVRADARAAADAAVSVGGTRVRLRGPAEAPIPRVRGRSRFQVWLASVERAPLAAAARAGSAVKLGPDVRLVVDVDPQSTL